MDKDLFELKKGIIVACDVHSLEQLSKLVQETNDVEGVVGYKIGSILSLRFGLPAISLVARKQTRKPIIYDHQKAGTDIPQTGEPFAEACREGGIQGVIIFPQAGPETEVEYIKALFQKGLTPLVGGEMTHPKYLTQEGGFLRDNSPNEIYETAAKCGVEYFIVPGNRPESISGYRALLTPLVSNPKFCMPGIGRQGGDIKVAFKAAQGMPSYAIIGSAIYKQGDIRSNAKKFSDIALSLK